jgi:hypothetical protein
MNPTPQERTRALAGGLLLTLFIAGGLVGAATATIVRPLGGASWTEPAEPRSQDRRGPRAQRGLKMDSLIFEEIGASSDQRAAINGILDRRDHLIRQHWSSWESHFDTLLNETRGEVRSLLSEEQVRKLDQAIAERRARWRSRQNEADRKTRDSDPPKTRTPLDALSLIQ